MGLPIWEISAVGSIRRANRDGGVAVQAHRQRYTDRIKCSFHLRWSLALMHTSRLPIVMRHIRAWLRWVALALLLSMAWSSAAMAQARDCTLTLNPLSFGNYDPLETTVPVDRTTSMNIRCNRNTFVQIFYSTGSSGNYAARSMRLGASTLGYNFYFEAAHVSILGDGTGGSFFLQGTVGRGGANITLYGRIPPGQDPLVGPHSDTIIVTTTF